MKKSPKFSSKQNYSNVKNKVLYLINDEYNTFDYVIDCLVTLCGHDKFQAEQCAIITHYKGICEIAIGNNADLLLLEEDLTLYGLDVEIR